MKKNEKGFTLIELMVVVAIIGILAAVAVPRFLKFMAQSRRTEAKTILSAVFNAQSATLEGLNFRASQAAATSTGYTDLFNAGFTPASPVKLYTYGTDTTASLTCPPTGAACTVANGDVTYQPHVQLTFDVNSNDRGTWFNASMCGDPNVDGSGLDQFAVASEGGREPVLCTDDLEDGAATDDSTSAAACDAPLACT